MKQRVLLITLFVGALFSQPTPAHAEGCGWNVLCVLGVTQVMDRDAQRREEEKRLDVQIQANLNASNQELQRIQNAQYESDNQKQIALRNAELAQQTYQAQLDAWKDQQLNIFDNQTKALIEAGHDQADIAQRGIVEAAGTARAKLAWDGSYNIITVLVLGAIVAAFASRRKEASTVPPTVVYMQPPVLPPPPTYPQVETIKVQGYIEDEADFWMATAQGRAVQPVGRQIRVINNALPDHTQYLTRGDERP